MKNIKQDLENIKNKILYNSLFEAKVKGICLSNNPKKDYLIIKEKNKNKLEHVGIMLEEFSKENESIIGLKLIHKDSGLVLLESGIKLVDWNNTINTPDVFMLRRLIYECVFGIASSNDILDYKIFIDSSIKTKELVDQDGVITKKEIIYNPRYWEFSWSDIKLFLQCQKCFYNQKKDGIKPPMFDSEGFALPNAVDNLLKKEFDQYRKKKKPHPIMSGTDIIRPLNHKKLKKWKNAWLPQKKEKGGIQFKDVWKNCFLYGGIDDLWLNEEGEIVVVEYKTLAEDKIHPDFKEIRYSNFYKKQVEFYAWLLKKNNYKVSSTGYIIFYSPITNKETFNCKLEFKEHLYPVEIDYYWIEPTLNNALLCLKKDISPTSGKSCRACGYFTKLMSINESKKMILKNNVKSRI